MEKKQNESETRKCMGSEIRYGTVIQVRVDHAERRLFFQENIYIKNNVFNQLNREKEKKPPQSKKVYYTFLKFNQL